MESLLSVIVPVHNAEEYLKECIESIIRQTYHNLEIILVDDCSDDNSADICDVYAEQDSRIRVIHHKVKGGEGGAKARNTGLEAARGDLLYFMDSDDYIEDYMLSEMCQIMCHEGSDCVVSSFHYIDEEGEELPWHTPQLSAYGTVSGKEAARIFLTTLNVEGFSWNKLFKKRLIAEHNICFDASRNSFVDMFGMFKAILYSKKVSFYDSKPYYYRQRDVSCVHTMNQRKLGNFKYVINQISKLAVESGMLQEADFFYVYRMTLQLYDAIKAKRQYSWGVWRQIEQEYKWSNVYGGSLLSAYKVLFSYLSEEKIKAGIKLFRVWVNFR